MGENGSAPNGGKDLRAAVVALLFLAAGIYVIWLGKKKLGLEGDAIYVALLLIPILVYLALADKLKKLSVPGMFAAEFHERVDKLEKNVTGKVTEIGAYESEKSAYFGKLQQVLSKAGNDFCLLYADVDGLRPLARKKYLEPAKPAAGAESSNDRKTEKQIRSEIIAELGFALADAFCEDPGTKEAKYDLFFLEEPDLVMIARSVNLKSAREIAEKGQKQFQHSATVAVGSPAQLAQDPTPQALHEMLSKRLDKRTTLGKGRIYDGT